VERSEEPAPVEAAEAPVVEEPRQESPPEPQGWSDDDIEYQLAVIETGGYVSPDDPLVDRFAAALDRAERKCDQDRRMIGDMSVRATELAEERGVATSPFEMITGLDEAVPDSAAPMDCAEVLSALLVMMTAG
jgi:hypothetical protein